MSDHIPLKFESLPNELILEIFDYVNFHDLIKTFCHLNSRLKTIVFSSNLHLYILYPDDVQNSISYQQFLLQFLHSQRYLSRLRLDSNQLTVNNHFINYSHIRSLIIDVPTVTIFNSLTPQAFPRLEYLRLGYSSIRILPSELFQNIFSNQFLYLKRCSLNHINTQTLWSGSPMITSLSVCSDKPNIIIERVLIALENLRTFHLFLTLSNSSIKLNEQISFQHKHLQSFKLHMSGEWSLDKLDSLFFYIPTVKYLGVYSSYFDSNMTKFHWNFSRLATILQNRLPKLIQFDCELILVKDKFGDIIHHMPPFHSCFHRIEYEIYSENDAFIRIFTS